MSSDKLLEMEPPELKISSELKKQISCSLHLVNKTDEHVAFKTTSPKKYCVRPNNGIVPPRSTCDVIVAMQAQREAPPDMQCKDTFLVQSVIVVTPEMFSKESGNTVHEFKLRVTYVPPPQPFSSVREGSEEGSLPRASLSENGNSTTTDFGTEAKLTAETQEKPSEESLPSPILLSQLRELLLWKLLEMLG